MRIDPFAVLALREVVDVARYREAARPMEVRLASEDGAANAAAIVALT